ncbi:unnamed protein product [Effrenium voratum]|uniref:Uncharacterized protein n=1 Tax=Effrenium voratum TaxID=2562239 RepID=A0AA36JK82_9DINO|nr:unnamed protein product [Effrenium voratum]
MQLSRVGFFPTQIPSEWQAWIQGFLQKSPLFALADFFTNIAARAQKVQEEGYLQTYQPVVSTQLVGHARPREGVRVKAGAAGAAKLSEEQRADPAAGRCSEVNVAADHPVRTYVNKVYRSVHVADHLYGQEDALVWQEVPLENGSYRGQVSRGKLSGAGVAKWADDSRYEGQWQEGSMQGLGAFTKPDGSCYQGQWAAGKMHGRGVLTSPDGHRFEGEWRDGEQL